MGKCIFLRVGCLFLLWFPMVGCQCRYWRCCKKPVSCNYYNGHPVSLMGRGSTFLSWNKKQSKHAWIELFQTFSCLILIVCSGGDWVLCAKESSGIKTSYLISSGIPYSCFSYKNLWPPCFSIMFFREYLCKKHISEICFVGFVIYFWVFSFSVGFYKPQFKKEYEMMNYNDGWYYVLARYDTTLVLSKSFKSGNGRFLVIGSEQLKDYEFNMVRVNL